MIQRKQTLFLLFVLLAGLVLLFIPSTIVYNKDGSHYSIPFLFNANDALSVTIWHYAGLALCLATIVLSLITVFMYKQRPLQIKLCYVLLFLSLGITLIVAFCPTVAQADNIEAIKPSAVALVIGVAGILAAYLAARNIKKDIELLKSVDRIR